MWNPEHPYGSLRLDLLEHLIRECEDAIDNGGYNDATGKRQLFGYEQDEFLAKQYR